MKRIRIADLFRPLRQSQPGSRIFFFSLLYISVVTDVLPARLFIQLSFICLVEFSFSSAKIWYHSYQKSFSECLFDWEGGGELCSLSASIHGHQTNESSGWSQIPKREASTPKMRAPTYYLKMYENGKKIDRERGVHPWHPPLIHQWSLHSMWLLVVAWLVGLSVWSVFYCLENNCLPVLKKQSM